MKISEFDAAAVAAWLKLGEDEWSETELLAVMDAAKQYVCDYTGLPAVSVTDEPSLDDYADLTIAWLTLCQDLYDHRSAYADGIAAGRQGGSAVNRTLDTILGMHARNLV